MLKGLPKRGFPTLKDLIDTVPPGGLLNPELRRKPNPYAKLVKKGR